MILPIYAFGQPVLRKVAEEIEESFENLDELVENMFETMRNARGVGLAAPQIGQSIRLFIVDTQQMDKPDEPPTGIRKTFINAQMLDESGDPWVYEEGCLSIPEIHADVERKSVIHLRYFDQEWKEHTETFAGVNARVIQHEYDHIEGILFIDHMRPLKKRMIKGKLERIKKGDIEVKSPMRFVKS
jgi:peptide deformylase